MCQTLDGTGSIARRYLVLVCGAIGTVLLVVVGCGGSPAAVHGSGSGAPQSAAADANAPEVNAAGDIPDSQVFVPYAPAGGTVTVSVPQGWAQSSAGGGTVFTDKFNSVRIETRPRPTPPDVASVRVEEPARLKESVPGFVLGDVRTVQRSAGPALLVTYQAVSPPNPVTGSTVPEAVQRYLFWRDGREVIVTLSGPKGADNVDPWRTITDSLRWQR